MLRAGDCYEVIVYEAENRINYQLTGISSENSNCFSRILTEINANNGFQLSFDVYWTLRFNKIALIELSLGYLQLITRAHPFFNNFKFLKSRNRLCTSVSLFRNLLINLRLNFLLKLQKNDENVAFHERPTATAL